MCLFFGLVSGVFFHFFTCMLEVKSSLQEMVFVNYFLLESTEQKKKQNISNRHTKKGAKEKKQQTNKYKYKWATNKLFIFMENVAMIRIVSLCVCFCVCV